MTNTKNTEPINGYIKESNAFESNEDVYGSSNGFDFASLRVNSEPGFLNKWSLFISGFTWCSYHYYLTYSLVKDLGITANPLNLLRLRLLQLVSVILYWILLVIAVYLVFHYHNCVKFHLDHFDEFPKIYSDHALQAALMHEDLKNYRLYMQLFGAFFLAPFRLLFGIGVMVAPIFLICMPQKLLGNNFKDLTRWYTVCVLQFLTTIGFWGIGIWNVKTVYANGKPQKPVCTISNHIGILDVMYMVNQGAYSYVCKKTLEKAPCIGQLVRLLNCITVDRDSPENRKIAYSEIVDRMTRITEGHEKTSLVVYPESTATRGNIVLPFRHGAFGALVPLQPLLIVLDYSYLNITFDAFPWKWWVCIAFCSPIPAKLIAYWLPTIYPPSKEEIELKGKRECVREYALRAHRIMCEAMLKLNPHVEKNFTEANYVIAQPSTKGKLISRLYGPIIQRYYKISDEELRRAEN